jgi:DNA-directed RNA polymerase
LSKAENKLLFLVRSKKQAFCFEYNRWLNNLDSNSTHFITYLPIQLDATCNGYQHLSMLSLDHKLAKQLNLTKSNWKDDPQDFYS